jgi:hypothetical protein
MVPRAAAKSRVTLERQCVGREKSREVLAQGYEREGGSTVSITCADTARLFRDRTGRLTRSFQADLKRQGRVSK